MDESERMRRARASRTFTRGRRFHWNTLATVVGQLFIPRVGAGRTHLRRHVRPRLEMTPCRTGVAPVSNFELLFLNELFEKQTKPAQTKKREFFHMETGATPVLR